MRIVKVRSVTSFGRVMGELGIHGMREVMVREVTRSGKGWWGSCVRVEEAQSGRGSRRNKGVDVGACDPGNQVLG